MLQLVLVSPDGILMTMPVSVVDHTTYVAGLHSPAQVSGCGDCKDVAGWRD